MFYQGGLFSIKKTGNRKSLSNNKRVAKIKKKTKQCLNSFGKNSNQSYDGSQTPYGL